MTTLVIWEALENMVFFLIIFVDFFPLVEFKWRKTKTGNLDDLWVYEIDFNVWRWVHGSWTIDTAEQRSGS
jgi:hypothetical protein